MGCCEFPRNLKWELSDRFVVYFVHLFAPSSTASPAAMPGIEKLPIEETLEDSPQVTALFPGGFSFYANVSYLYG